MTEPPAEPTLRERLGGRWAISWQAFLLTIPFAVIAVVVSSTRSWDEVPAWILVGLFGALTAGAWVLLMHRTVFRNRATRAVSLTWGLAHPAITIALAIAGTVIASLALDLPQESGPLTRAIPTLLVGTLWSIAITLFLEAHWRFGQERDALVERAVQQQVAALQEAQVAETIRTSLRTEITDHLARTRARVEEQLASIERDASTTSAAAAELREAARKAVRPLSHELAQRAERAHPRPGILAVLRNIIERQRFRPLAVSIIYLVTTGPREVEDRGWTGGLVAAVGTVALIWLTMSIANGAMRRWPHRHAALFIAGIALIELPSIVLPPIIANATATTVDWPDVLISVGFGVVIILLTSGFGSLRATRRDLLRTFATDVNDDEVATIARSRTLAATAREAASVLHGPVQTKLIACAMAIEHAAASNDIVAVNNALVQARAVLAHPVPNLAQECDTTIAAEVERKADLWRGLVDITIDIDPQVGLIDGSLARNVGAVVEEGIANAIQHGAATKIIITVANQEGLLSVRIADNGSGSTGSPGGLGSELLDRLAPGWQLDIEPQGACLHVSLNPLALSAAHRKPPVPSSPMWA